PGRSPLFVVQVRSSRPPAVAGHADRLADPDELSEADAGDAQVAVADLDHPERAKGHNVETVRAAPHVAYPDYPTPVGRFDGHPDAAVGAVVIPGVIARRPVPRSPPGARDDERRYRMQRQQLPCLRTDLSSNPSTHG